MGKNGEISDYSAPGNGSNPFADSLYNDINPRQALQFWQAQRPEQGTPGDVVLGSAFPVGDQMLPAKDTPEGQEFHKAMEGPGAMRFSSPVDNAADGKTPDYRMVEENGQLKMVRTGDGDPMADGELNIEIDPKNKSLQDALEQDDKNMKEFARQMISYWQKNHPGEPIPGWWQSLLDKQPSVAPEQQRPTPISRSTNVPPANVPAPAPPAQNPAWQGDYRQGGGSGYGRSGYGGSRGNPGGDSYYNPGRPGTDVPSNVPQFKDNQFVDKVMKTVMANEGAMQPDGAPKFTAYNPDDNGGISVGIRQWHAGGALPELLNAWQQADPTKFQEYFKGYSPAQINSMNSQQFASTPGMEEGMKKALEDPKYQGVQLQLMQDWTKREIKMAMDTGLTGEREIATYVDVANQYGQDKATSIAPLGKGSGDQSDAMSAAARNGQYGERQARINENFSTQSAKLEPTVPQTTQFGEKLAKAVEYWDSQMAGTGWCARAVQRALKDAGLPQFVGSGDAWNMLGPLKRSGLFVEIPMSEATRGDLIVRPGHPGGSIQGDISVVTARNGNRIQQTNDATYDFRPDNPRYGGQAVFLRYVGDQKSASTDAPAGDQPTNRRASNETEVPAAKKKSA